MPPIVRLPDRIPGDAPREPVDGDRLVAGEPSQAVENRYASPDLAFQCGIWGAMLARGGCATRNTSSATCWPAGCG